MVEETKPNDVPVKILDSAVKVEGIVFCCIAAVLQFLVFVLFATFGFSYSGLITATRYAYFRDVNIMIFFGFGFLMSFLRRYGYSAIGFTLIVSALVVQISLLLEYVVHTSTGSAPEKWPLTLDNLTHGLFCAGAVMISFGAILGKVTPSQLLVMALVETIFFWINLHICIYEIEAHDVGGGMVIHMFGAYFGLVVTAMFSGRQAHDHGDEVSSYMSDITSLAGTLFLWLLWPSFQAAVAPTEKEQSLAVMNTFISLCAGTVTTAFATRLLSNFKFDIVQIQNATLAGGVAMGVAGDLVDPHWAVAGGSLAGAVSCLGYSLLAPLLAKLGIQDVCGVHNLHGMPGVISAIIGIVAAPSAGKQAGALGATLGLAIVGGAVGGGIMRLLGKVTGTDLVRGDHYNDKSFWTVATDYHLVVGTDQQETAASKLHSVHPAQP